MKKSLLFGAVSLFCTALGAETLNGLEYNLPEGKSWKMKEFVFEKSAACNYAPEEGSDEFLGVAVTLTTKEKDEELKKETLEKGFFNKLAPNNLVKVEILEKTDDSALYSYTIKDGETLVMEGIGRAIVSGGKVGVLTHVYFQKAGDHAEWMDTLKKASFEVIPNGS